MNFSCDKISIAYANPIRITKKEIVEIEEIYYLYPYLKTFWFDMVHPPTVGQFRYAVNLGILIYGHSFESLSDAIDIYKDSDEKEYYYHIWDEADVVYKDIWNRSLDYMISFDDYSIIADYGMLLLPSEITYRTAQKLFNRFLGRMGAYRCPSCNQRLILGEKGNYYCCYNCNKSLKGLVARVGIDKSGKIVFSDKLEKPIFFSFPKAGKNIIEKPVRVLPSSYNDIATGEYQSNGTISIDIMKSQSDKKEKQNTIIGTNEGKIEIQTPALPKKMIIRSPISSNDEIIDYNELLGNKAEKSNQTKKKDEKEEKIEGCCGCLLILGGMIILGIIFKYIWAFIVIVKNKFF